MEETDGVSEVTDIVHLSMQEVLPAIFMSCLNTIGMRGLGSDGHDSLVIVSEQSEFIREKIRQAQAQPSGRLQTPVQADGRKRDDSTLTQHGNEWPSQQQQANCDSVQLTQSASRSSTIPDPDWPSRLHTTLNLTSTALRDREQVNSHRGSNR
jgi:hypothetical protein